MNGLTKRLEVSPTYSVIIYCVGERMTAFPPFFFCNLGCVVLSICVNISMPSSHLFPFMFVLIIFRIALISLLSIYFHLFLIIVLLVALFVMCMTDRNMK